MERLVELYLILMDVRRFNNPEVVLSSEIRIRDHQLRLTRFRKKWFSGKRAQKKVEKRCRKRALAIENAFFEIFGKTGRFENQKTGFPLAFGLQNSL